MRRLGHPRLKRRCSPLALSLLRLMLLRSEYVASYVIVPGQVPVLPNVAVQPHKCAPPQHPASATVAVAGCWGGANLCGTSTLWALLNSGYQVLHLHCVQSSPALHDIRLDLATITINISAEEGAAQQGHRPAAYGAHGQLRAADVRAGPACVVRVAGPPLPGRFRGKLCVQGALRHPEAIHQPDLEPRSNLTPDTLLDFRWQCACAGLKHE